MAESMPSPRDESAMDTTGVYANSTTPEDDGETLMRATDTPLETSPAPTGVTIATGSKKRKYPSGANFGDADDEDEPPKKKKGTSKGKKVGTGKSVGAPFTLAVVCVVLTCVAWCRRKASTPATSRARSKNARRSTASSSNSATTAGAGRTCGACGRQRRGRRRVGARCRIGTCPSP